MAQKIKILFLAANPVDTNNRLRLDEEFREIRKKLRACEQRDSFELVCEWAVTPDDFQEILMTHKPHILHFSGHGSPSEGIALEDKFGNTCLLDKRAFAELLAILKDNIRIVVLNACYAKDQAELLTSTIDFTIGMNKTIGDKAAIVFAAHFYQGLGFGRSVQEAFRLAKVQLPTSGIAGYDTPELLERYGVNPNKSILKKCKPPKDEAQEAGKKNKGGDRSDVVFNNENSDIGIQVGKAKNVFEPKRGRKKHQIYK